MSCSSYGDPGGTRGLLRKVARVLRLEPGTQRIAGTSMRSATGSDADSNAGCSKAATRSSDIVSTPAKNPKNVPNMNIVTVMLALPAGGWSGTAMQQYRLLQQSLFATEHMGIRLPGGRATLLS